MPAELLFQSILLGFLAGVVTRLILLRVDYRQYPSVPHNYVSHLAFGVIASGVGAVAVPALAEREFTAVTFLVLAATQFREVREMERKTLLALESQLLVPRGVDYIEGIAAVFEARNYLAMGVALVASAAAVAARSVAVGLGVAAVALLVSYLLRSGSRLGDVAGVRLGDLHFDGPDLYIDDIYIMNVGTAAERSRVARFGLGILVEPRDPEARDKLAHPGQRQAVLHEVSAALGTRQEMSEPELTALARKDLETGTLGFFVAPVIQDLERVLAIIKRVPLLESARGSRPGAASRLLRDGGSDSGGDTDDRADSGGGTDDRADRGGGSNDRADRVWDPGRGPAGGGNR